jgi:hypothetical protein
MRRRLAFVLLTLAIAAFAVAIYLALNREVPVEVMAQPESGHPSYWPSARGYETIQPSVTIADDGLSCVVVVPAHISEGVRAEDKSGKQFIIKKGENFEIIATGLVEFASNKQPTDADGLPKYWDKSVDSPFYKNVGGLEFSIGSLAANRYFAGRSYRGKAKDTGVPIFRVIESINGYYDGNYGAFSVNVRKR